MKNEYYFYGDMVCVVGTVNSYMDYAGMIEDYPDAVEIETPDYVEDDMLFW